MNSGATLWKSKMWLLSRLPLSAATEPSTWSGLWRNRDVLTRSRCTRVMTTISLTIFNDLLMPFDLGGKRMRIVGGLLGHWAIWTKTPVAQLQQGQAASKDSFDILALGARMTDANAAVFDAANQFRGCIPGIHEILRRQGLLAGRWCLDESEDLSPGQLGEIDRVCRSYPDLQDDTFVKEHLDEWLR